MIKSRMRPYVYQKTAFASRRMTLISYPEVARTALLDVIANQRFVRGRDRVSRRQKVSENAMKTARKLVLRSDVRSCPFYQNKGRECDKRSHQNQSLSFIPPQWINGTGKFAREQPINSRGFIGGTRCLTFCTRNLLLQHFYYLFVQFHGR